MDRAFSSGSSASPPAAPASPSLGYATAGNPGTGTPSTKPGAYWYHMITEEMRAVIAAAGIAATQSDLTQMSQALRRVAGGNVTTVNFAASPFQLTADHAGMVLVDAAGGNVVINLPAANVLTGLPYAFRRTDASVNTVTVNRAGADTIDEGGVSFSLTSKAIQQVRSNGVTTWSTVTPVAATQAEANAGTDDVKFVTALKLRSGFAISLTTNGYIKFPTWLGGLIVQWGVDIVNSVGPTTVTLPLAFPVAHAVVLTTASVAGETGYVSVDSKSLTNFVVRKSGATFGSLWVSIGY